MHCGTCCDDRCKAFKHVPVYISYRFLTCQVFNMKVSLPTSGTPASCIYFYRSKIDQQLLLMTLYVRVPCSTFLYNTTFERVSLFPYGELFLIGSRSSNKVERGSFQSAQRKYSKYRVNCDILLFSTNSGFYGIIRQSIVNCIRNGDILAQLSYTHQPWVEFLVFSRFSTRDTR
jgi:hypothetical protein